MFWKVYIYGRGVRERTLGRSRKGIDLDKSVHCDISGTCLFTACRNDRAVDGWACAAQSRGWQCRMNLKSFLIALEILLLLVELQHIIERFFELISRRDGIKVATRGSANQLTRDQSFYLSTTFNCQLLFFQATLLPNCCSYQKKQRVAGQLGLEYYFIYWFLIRQSRRIFHVFRPVEGYISHLSILYHALQRTETDETCNKTSASPRLSHHPRPPSLGNDPIYQMTNFSTSIRGLGICRSSGDRLCSHHQRPLVVG